MKIFDDVTRQVRFYLSENHYCHSLIKANERCFRSLEAYLKEKGVDYSPEIAKKWIEDLPVGEKEKSMILGDNARRLLRL